MTTLSVLQNPMPEPIAPQKLKDKVALLLERAQGEHHPVPAALYHLIRNLLEHLQRGESFTVLPQDCLLTTQQTAQILNVSLAYMNQLLEDEPATLHAEVVGSHRLFQLVDVLKLREKRFQQRTDILDSLSALGQELQGKSW